MDFDNFICNADQQQAINSAHLLGKRVRVNGES